MISTIKKIDRNLRSLSSIFGNSENVLQLIREGKEAEAKELFPLEHYLVKKYLYNDFENFKNQLAGKLALE